MKSPHERIDIVADVYDAAADPEALLGLPATLAKACAGQSAVLTLAMPAAPSKG